jgi:hypothetical protein
MPFILFSIPRRRALRALGRELRALGRDVLLHNPRQSMFYNYMTPITCQRVHAAPPALFFCVSSPLWPSRWPLSSLLSSLPLAEKTFIGRFTGVLLLSSSRNHGPEG